MSANRTGRRSAGWSEGISPDLQARLKGIGFGIALLPALPDLKFKRHDKHVDA